MTIKRKTKWYPKKFAMNMFILVLMLIAAWVTMSWLEVVIKNVRPNPDYSEYNFWVNHITMLGGLK